MTKPDACVARKRSLRRQILADRDGLSRQEIWARSGRIRAHLESLPELRAARTVHLFVSFGTEVDTGPILESLWRRGARVVVPRVAGRRRLEHRTITSLEDLEPGYRSIPEPRSRCARVAPAEVDLVLVPGVAFDRRGGRLGYGGGYYDQFLSECPAPRVALAFASQIVDEVPREPHDLRVDALVTDREVLRLS